MPKYKAETIQVSLSESFLCRSKCIHCGGAPKHYFYKRNPTLWNDPRKAIADAEELKEIIKSLYRKGLFKKTNTFYSVSLSSKKILGSNYRPRLHRTKGTIPFWDIVEMVSCDCMLTTWSFSQESVRWRKEISNRKCRYLYPKKFTF